MSMYTAVKTIANSVELSNHNRYMIYFAGALVDEYESIQSTEGYFLTVRNREKARDKVTKNMEDLDGLEL